MSSSELSFSAVLVMSLCSACSVHGSPSAAMHPTTLPSRGTGAQAEAAEAQTHAIPSCKDVGLLACDVPPRPLAELCSRYEPCLIGTDGTEPNPGPVRDFKCDAI